MSFLIAKISIFFKMTSKLGIINMRWMSGVCLQKKESVGDDKSVVGRGDAVR